jgi:phosphoribosylglycinamide formyltransferase-1
MTQIAFRPAVEADVPFLLALRRQTMAPHVRAAGLEPPDNEWLERVMADFDCAQILLAGDRPVGLLKVVRKGRAWHLSQIQLLPELQGRGIGTALVGNVVAEARRAGASLDLDVLKANPARRLYERLGFCIVRETPFAYDMRLDVYDERMPSPLRLAIFASHEGTTLQAILDAVRSGRLRASIEAVISNNRESGALRRARAAGVRAIHLSSATHPEPGRLDAAILATLRERGVDTVFLAGYMKKLGPAVLTAYADRVFNTHPALLPKHGGHGMYGRKVHEAVLAAKETETGASIHLVDDGYDTGRVIAQCRVPVLPTDSPETLAARVQERERELVIETLAKLAGADLPGGSD